jgi:hypothetical protein
MMSERPDQQLPAGGADVASDAPDVAVQEILPLRPGADRLTRFKVEPQLNFTPVEFKLCRAALHLRVLPPRTDSVVIFVHGLNGDGYSTWGEFPERMFDSTYGRWGAVYGSPSELTGRRHSDQPLTMRACQRNKTPQILSLMGPRFRLGLARCSYASLRVRCAHCVLNQVRVSISCGHAVSE